MLKLEDIKFPITFTTDSGNVTFGSPTKARWDDLTESAIPISFCIRMANIGSYRYTMEVPDKEPVQVYYRCLHCGGVSKRFNSLAEAQAHANERAALFPRDSITIVREVAVVTVEIVQSSKVKVEYL